MKSLLLTVLLCFALVPLRADDTAAPAAGAASSPAAAIDPAKQAEIRKMIELTGVLKMMDQMKVRMIGMFQAQHSDLPPEFWTRLSSEMDMNVLLERMIPVYDKYYTLDDLKGINAFYESPTGKRMTSVAPQLMADSMKVGQAWGQEVGMRAGAEIEKEQSAKAAAATPASGATQTPPPASTAK